MQSNATTDWSVIEAIFINNQLVKKDVRALLVMCGLPYAFDYDQIHLPFITLYDCKCVKKFASTEIYKHQNAAQ